MSDTETNLSNYTLQLEQVTKALEIDPNNDDLKQLANDLGEVVKLLTETLLQEKKQELLKQLEQSQEQNEVNQEEKEWQVKEVQGLKNDLKALVGMKCRAPFVSRGQGSAKSMHNAIIFHVEEGMQNPEVMSQVNLRVVFSHPTSKDMIPCPFYLDGKCRFHEDSCKFSHGEIVSLEDLTEFEDPDFGNLAAGSFVLAKTEGDRIWSHAKVGEIEGEFVHLRFSHGGNQGFTKVHLKNVFPLLGSNENDEDEENEKAIVENVIDPEMTSFTPVDLLNNFSPVVLGDWEKHTKGVGSKLMAKMGYVFGQGLGVKGEGRVEPVAAFVYPGGKSLDWCMEMKEKSGGKDTLSVESKLRKQKEKAEKQSQKNKGHHANMFDFINKKLGGKRGRISDLQGPKPSTSSGSQNVKSSSGEVCNVDIFKLGQKVLQSEKDLRKLKAAYDRNRVRDPRAAAGIKVKMDEKEQEIRMLKAKEDSLTKKKKQHAKKMELF